MTNVPIVIIVRKSATEGFQNRLARAARAHFGSLPRLLAQTRSSRGVPHSFEMRFELADGAGVAENDEIIILRVFARGREIGRAGPQHSAVAP